MTNEKLQNDCGICFVIESRKYQFSLSRSRVTLRLSSVRWENKYTANCRSSHLILNHFTNCKWAKREVQQSWCEDEAQVLDHLTMIHNKIYLFAHFEAYASHFECSPINYKTQHTPKTSHIAFWRSSLSSLLWFIGFMRPRNKSHLRNKSNRNSKHCTTMTNTTRDLMWACKWHPMAIKMRFYNTHKKHAHKSLGNRGWIREEFLRGLPTYRRCCFFAVFPWAKANIYRLVEFIAKGWGVL